ncbi:MAG: ureidoglycolate lyase [Acidimicrobiales bacterium]
MPLSAAAWAPFGWLPLDEDDEAALGASGGTRRLAFAAQDPHLNVIGHLAEEVTRRGDVVVCHELYRHDGHTQALLVLDHRAVIAVAPASVAFEGPDAAGEIRAFLLEPLDALVLGRGTWHWGPFPVDAPAVRLLNLQARGYRIDSTRVDLAGRGIDVEVALAG